MGGSAQCVIEGLEGFDRLWWLPANGHGNGFEADAWVAMLDVADDETAEAILSALARYRIPG